MADDRTLRWAAMICAAILTLAGLWAASGVMTPVAFISSTRSTALSARGEAQNALQAAPDCAHDLHQPHHIDLFGEQPRSVLRPC